MIAFFSLSSHKIKCLVTFKKLNSHGKKIVMGPLRNGEDNNGEKNTRSHFKAWLWSTMSIQFYPFFPALTTSCLSNVNGRSTGFAFK